MTTSPPPNACPAATPEPLWVEPVDSPTDLSFQVVTVTIGNGDWVLIEAESGDFLATGTFWVNNPALATVSLLPCTTHHLAVTAHVREMGPPCWYGGYTLGTTRGRNGEPLVIVRGDGSCYRFQLPLVYR